CFFSIRRLHTRSKRDWSSDVCSSDLGQCGLPYLISGKVTSFEKLYARSVETFREKYNIDARVWTTVNSVDFTNQFVKTKSSQTNEEINIPYDKLLIASGSRPVIPDWEVKDLACIHTM